ncbi:DNA helicase [Trifolium repens]|nr:hypothetical protein QL285_096192 [Trifolium repens]WJX63841.1 DNA helicase [Trifolium repens]
MAESLQELLQLPPKGYFMTIHVAGEDNGEIEPQFYEEFKAELGRIWGLYDQHGFQHAVEFNDDDDIPRITNGWGFLRDHYKFTGHHQILFKYLGRNRSQINQFQIIPTMTPTNPSKFPTWHTSSVGLRKAVAFEMKITEDPDVVSYLTLPEEMGEFLANSGLDEVWIAGTNGEKHKCILRYQFDPFVVRIESGWREVVGINNLHVGEWIVFHIYDIYKDHLVWVRKIGEDWVVEKLRGN